MELTHNEYYSNLADRRILLVEDQVIIANSIAQALIKIGYPVVKADNGEKAIRKVKKHACDIDLILMDIDLGDGIDGTATSKEILKIYKVPIVFLSSYTAKEVVEKTRGIASYGYVVKNSGDAVLEASIGMALRLFDAHRHIELQKIEMEKANDILQTAINEMKEKNKQLLQNELDLQKCRRELEDIVRISNAEIQRLEQELNVETKKRKEMEIEIIGEKNLEDYKKTCSSEESISSTD